MCKHVEFINQDVLRRTVCYADSKLVKLKVFKNSRIESDSWKRKQCFKTYIPCKWDIINKGSRKTINKKHLVTSQYILKVTFRMFLWNSDTWIEKVNKRKDV